MKVDGLIGEIIFGPVDSRRYGRSLGVNPLPSDVKLCNFNCPYCECGWTAVKTSRRPDPSIFPSVERIEAALRNELLSLSRQNRPIDNITVAGNGEPTMHPDFPQMVDRLLAVRDELAPSAGLVILSNSTNLDRPVIVDALCRLDEQNMKLDAGTKEMFRKLALPISDFDLDAICEQLKQLPNLVIQSMFVRGRIDNTVPEEISAWLARIRELRPKRVQIYSLDRRPPDKRLLKVPGKELHKIAKRVEDKAGVETEVFI